MNSNRKVLVRVRDDEHFRAIKALFKRQGRKLKKCACGHCNTYFPSPNEAGRVNRFVWGHQRGWKNSAASNRKRAATLRKRWQSESPEYRQARLAALRSGRPEPRRGADHPRWNGGIWVSSDGYRHRKVEADSPFFAMAQDKGNGIYYVPEHRLVVAEGLGRLLTAGEVVHHRDSDRKNNELSNLRLMTPTEHRRLHGLMAKNLTEAEAWQLIQLDRLEALSNEPQRKQFAAVESV